MGIRISAVIITFNEERNIGRCLASLEGVVDEVVVVDSYSTDGTEAICLAHGARFIRHRFFGHIQQKNWALLQASHPYILSLDADEALSAELRASILHTRDHWEADGYYFNRLTNYCGKWIRHTTWYPSRKLRLWDARKGAWGGFNPHDRFELVRGSTRRHLKGDILHYSYYSVNEHIAQINRFSTILARSYFERGKRIHLPGLMFRPTWRFIKDYLLRLGFLDGYYGMVVSVNSAHEVFLKYVKLRDLSRSEERSKRHHICCLNSMRSWGGGEKWHADVAEYLSGLGMPVRYITAPDTPLSRQMERMGIPGKQMGISNLSFLNPVKIIRMARDLRRHRVGVLICNLSVDMKLAGIAGRLAGVPKIVYRRGSAIPVRNSLLNRYLFRKVLTHVVANSLETRRTILVNNPALVPESKISVIYNGVHVSRYGVAKPLLQEGKDAIVLGAAGRLSEEKGQVYLLKMMRILVDKGLNVRLLIAGEGPLLPELKKMSEALGISERVRFLGFVDDMPSFFRSLDVFLLSSYYEGFGYVIAEAMASNLPVVAFDIKSSAEIIDHGVTGFVTPRQDAEALAENVALLAADPALRQRMGAAGRQRVEANFSFEDSMKKVQHLISTSN